MKYILLLFFILVYGLSHGQSVKYFSENGEPSSKEDCFYYAEGGEADGDTLRTHFCSNDSLRSVQPRNGVGVATGETLFYFENGKLRSRMQCAGVPVGLVETWYPDGKKQSEEFFEPDSFSPRLISYWDSTGVQLIRDGQGFCRCVFEAWRHGTLIELGKLVNGLRDSVWIAHRDGSLYFKETFEQGKLVSGLSFDREGNQYTYKELVTPARPQGGMGNFYESVGNTIKYPKEARRSKIEGKVYVEFIVEKDGSITRTRVIKGIDKACDLEAERAVSLSKNWIPAMQRGQYVRQKMILPITFKVS